MDWKIVPILILVGFTGGLVFFPWKDASARRRTPLALILLAPPGAVYFWGDAFAIQPGARARLSAAWIKDFPDAAMALAVLLPIVLCAILPGARRFCASLGLAGFVLTFAIGFVATMQVTGVWL